MSKDLVSIIIPVYNVEPYLHRCLDSVLAQTHIELEIILINDGSTDNSLEICQEYLAIDQRIRLISQTNQGLSAARNKGLDICTGQYILFLDSDDAITDDTVQAALTTLKQHPECDHVQYPIHCDIGSGKDYVQSINHSPILGKDSLIYTFSREKLINWRACGQLYSADLLRNIRFKVGSYYEDNLFVAQVMEVSSGIAFCSNGLYQYYANPNSITHKPGNNKRYIDMITIHVDIYHLLKKYPQYKDEQALALYRITNLAYASYISTKDINHPVFLIGISILSSTSLKDFIFCTDLPLRRRLKMTYLSFISKLPEQLRQKLL